MFILAQWLETLNEIKNKLSIENLDENYCGGSLCKIDSIKRCVSHIRHIFTYEAQKAKTVLIAVTVPYTICS